ncbi:EAL domain-containing protein [Jatrophihabitans telluris]|uniref:EAL domain-containing protein n=1 Tax=Jatrophihabitans telluris TaxID=2038343 RepID=A0ABY4R020_9ACTN|nr:EAL domain-containing protein [Jatrophihabitans telluris]UQX89084.1 EAL domain-containing protein [Jatrophihabitans telluris]
MGAEARRARAVQWGLAAGFVLLFTLLVCGKVFDDRVTRAISDIGQGLAAATAAVCAGWRSHRTLGRRRRSWQLLAAATGSWAAGEIIWTYYEVWSTRDAPFPSLADVGFLLFPAFALPGILLRPSNAFAGRGRIRLTLDGLMLTASLFSISWVTTMGEVYGSGAESSVGLLVSLAYPVSDLVLVTIAVLVVVQAQSRTGLLILICGMVGMACADSGFSFLSAEGTYHTGSVIDIGWTAAFLLIGLAALSDQGSGSKTLGRNASFGYLVLPYFIVLGGIGAASAGLLTGNKLDLAVTAVALCALLLRQLLTLMDNRKLTEDVAAQQEQLRFRAFHDTLTGLANRSLFYDRLDHALELHQRDLRPISLMFCDLDDFKLVNDTLGHTAGDQVLLAVADRLRATMRAGDTIARLGGDEFAILLEDRGDPIELSQRLLTALEPPVQVGERRVPVRASIGVTTVSPDQAPQSSQDIVRQADVAMYTAKRSGKSTSVRWRPELDDDNPDDLDLRLDLRSAVAAGSIALALQPILLMDGSPYAQEALARWRRNGRAVPPTTFIAVADRAGLLPDLDMTVIGKAVSLVDSLDPGEGISVNIGLSHLADPGLPQRLEDLFSRYGMNPERLIVEVPEDQSIDRPEVLRSLRTLRQLGVRIALDDFGVGYSSLSRISAVNPDIIKLDRSFIAPLYAEGKHTDFVAGIIDLAHRLNAMVIAEGVEDAGQLETLRSIGCDAVQGYLTGRPVERHPSPGPAMLEHPVSLDRVATGPDLDGATTAQALESAATV